MKTEKKSNESSCMTSVVIKEEPDSESVKIKEETSSSGGGGVGVSSGGGGAGGGGLKSEDASGEENVDCPRDTGLDPSNGEANMPGDSQNGPPPNQSLLNNVKQENELNNQSDELPADGIQPLVSNVLGKQMGSGAGGGEAQYMQQQSQIFVFSTTLANKGADAVLQGQYPSIIAYHCAQPATKKYLDVR